MIPHKDDDIRLSFVVSIEIVRSYRVRVDDESESIGRPLTLGSVIALVHRDKLALIETDYIMKYMNVDDNRCIHLFHSFRSGRFKMPYYKDDTENVNKHHRALCTFPGTQILDMLNQKEEIDIGMKTMHGRSNGCLRKG
jgi:hypothetical protein